MGNILSANITNVGEPDSFNPFPSKPLFLHVCSKNLLKTLWEKEKLLVSENFSFSLCVFYPFGELVIFIKFEIVIRCSANALNLEESKNCDFGMG